MVWPFHVSLDLTTAEKTKENNEGDEIEIEILTDEKPDSSLSSWKLELLGTTSIHVFKNNINRSAKLDKYMVFTANLYSLGLIWCPKSMDFRKIRYTGAQVCECMCVSVIAVVCVFVKRRTTIVSFVFSYQNLCFSFLAKICFIFFFTAHNTFIL